VGHTSQGEKSSNPAPWFPVEGQFESVADKAQVLSLPEIERKELLAARAAYVIRRQLDLERNPALAAAQNMTENNKKRKTESETEDRVSEMGEDQKFTVHKHLICAKSKFFKAACSKLWAEGEDRVVRLPEVKAETFQAYIFWVYSGKVGVNGSTTSGTSKASAELRQTTELYLLADVLDDLQLRNAAMRSLVLKSKVWLIQPSVALIKQVWDSTPSGSLLRKMIVDHTIMRFNRKIFEKQSVDYPKDLLHSIAVALMQKAPGADCETFIAGLDGYLEPEVSDNLVQSK
jgi:hypothetical protein